MWLKMRWLKMAPDTLAQEGPGLQAWGYTAPKGFVCPAACSGSRMRV